jgi:hypothetical protein
MPDGNENADPFRWMRCKMTGDTDATPPRALP